jgi:glutaconate CoA-transferase subunit B
LRGKDKMDAQHNTIEELMVCVVARDLKDGEIAWVGLGTGGRGFVLATGIPTAACLLAQHSHAPNLICMYGTMFEPAIDEMPESFADSGLISWRSRAQIPVEDALALFCRQMIDVGFVSGAQVDRFGNLNTVCIGNQAQPKVRLVGSIAVADHCANAGRTITIMDHNKRAFVEHVDFVSGVGYGDGPGFREDRELRGGGPHRIVTDLAVLGFDESSRAMQLLSVHPGVSVEQVQDSTGFDLLAVADVPTTQPPRESELRVLRTVVDPDGKLLAPQ